MRRDIQCSKHTDLISKGPQWEGQTVGEAAGLSSSIVGGMNRGCGQERKENTTVVKVKRRQEVHGRGRRKRKRKSKGLGPVRFLEVARHEV